MDDQELVRRVATGDGLLGFVPVLLGTYHVTRRGQSRARGDERPRVERLERMYPLDDDTPIAAYTAHPDAGVLWASDAAVRRMPALAPPPVPTPAPDARRILVVAPGAVGNLGDDLITAALVERVTRSCPDHDVELVTDGGALAADLGEHVWSGTIGEAVAALDRVQDEATSWLPVDPARLDGVVIGGGGNLNSIWHDDLVAHRAKLVEHLGRAGVPMIVTGQGIGPFTSDADARAVREMLSHAHSIGVRDESSRTELTRLGLVADVVGDDALGLAPVPDSAVRDALRAIGADPDAPIVTLHARLTSYVGIDEPTLNGWAAALDAIALERGAHVIGVALNWEPPLPEPVALLRLAREGKAPWRILDEPTRPRLAAGLLRRSKRALVGSYHAALVSIEAGVPTLYCAGSEYTRRKAEGLAALAELPPDLVVTPGTPADELADRFDSIERALLDGAGLQAASAAVEEWTASQLRRLTDRERTASGRPGA
jgi:polysaccharide pyruvyl transferase WcaK-like protein